MVNPVATASTTAAAQGTQPESEPQASVSTASSEEVRRAVSTSSTCDRKSPTTLDQERQQLVDQVYGSINAPMMQKLTSNQRGATWFAERVVDQAAYNAKNHFKELSQVEPHELALAKRQVLRQLDSKTINLIEGPKVNNGGLQSAQSYVAAQAILDSVTHYSAHQTLQNFRSQGGDDDNFVRIVGPALSREGKFAWTLSERKRDAEILQHELVHKLLMSEQIPQDCRYQVTDIRDPLAIGPEFEQMRQIRKQAWNDHKAREATEAQQKQQKTMSDYITGARSESERAQVVRNYTAAVNDPDISPEYRETLNKVLAALPQDELPPTSTHIDSTQKTYRAAEIKRAQQFAPPEVVQAMQAKSPHAFEQSRPATREELDTMRGLLGSVSRDVSAALARSEKLARRIGETSSSLQKTDTAQVREYRSVCSELEKTIAQGQQLCSNLEKLQPGDPNYSQLLTQFKELQANIQHQGGLNDRRGELGREMLVMERRYRLGNEPAKKLEVLANLSPAEKEKYILTLEGTLTRQLKNSGDISHTLKAIQAIDSDPKRLASYLYRLESGGNHEAVEAFATALKDQYPLKNELARLLAESTSRLSDSQKKKVEAIQNALNSVPSLAA